MNDVLINKESGGLGRRKPSGDMISGLLANGPAASGLTLDTTARFKSVDDAKAVGIDESYDSASVFVYEHIKEYFRINPNGDLYVMLVDAGTAYSEMLSNNAYAKQLLIDAGGQIKQLALAYNPTTSVTDLTSTVAAVTAAQVLADAEYASHRPVQILLEGKGATVTNAKTEVLRASGSKNVAVVAGQAKSIAELDATYAAVGTFLGAVSKAAVNENIGWVQKFNMYGGSLTTAAIGGDAITTISEGDMDTIHENGFVFFRTHIGKEGIYFNDSHTCTAATDDFAYIENNRTIDKAVRAIRAAILPRLNSPVLVDQETGKLSPEVVKSFEVEGRRALEELVKKSEVSGIDVFVDPDQNILATSELLMAFSLIPTGTARQITVTIGFSNPF